MGLSKWLGIDDLERENNELRQRLDDKNNMLASIHEKARDYMRLNCSIAHVGFEKIIDLADRGLDS